MRQGKQTVADRRGGLDSARAGSYCAPLLAPSSNGKTTDSDSVYRGSNPRGASKFSLYFNLIATSVAADFVNGIRLPDRAVDQGGQLDRQALRSDLNFQILKALAATGIAIPFPQRELWLMPTMPADRLCFPPRRALLDCVSKSIASR
jgi:hypothetical protein